MRKLNTFVHAHTVDDTGNIQSQTFGPDDKVPAWAQKAITNPDVWDGEDDTPADTEDDGGVKEPPRGGPGSSADAWRKFLESKDFEVPEGASAKDMQAAWDGR
jgi:hypothetical protein